MITKELFELKRARVFLNETKSGCSGDSGIKTLSSEWHGWGIISPIWSIFSLFWSLGFEMMLVQMKMLMYIGILCFVKRLIRAQFSIPLKTLQFDSEWGLWKRCRRFDLNIIIWIYPKFQDHENTSLNGNPQRATIVRWTNESSIAQ